MISRLCALFTALLFAALFATSFPASAGLWFTMIGGTCTDATFPEYCHNPRHVVAQVEMVDGYVPGTPFHAAACCESSPIATFWFSDGQLTWVSDFPPPTLGDSVSGVLSDVPGQSVVSIHWFDGWWFDAAGNDWLLAIEFSGFCCIYSGTFTEWVPGRIPEPPSLALLALGLAGLGFARRRQLT